MNARPAAGLRRLPVGNGGSRLNLPSVARRGRFEFETTGKRLGRMASVKEFGSGVGDAAGFVCLGGE
ncbi:hypothetical protein SAMN05216338_10198 [Bradyrhizobium sp. Rc2d]|nr:hypothetical protein SAMN05216338_10198 [Bradyrhizobium sp. Rc2d]